MRLLRMLLATVLLAGAASQSILGIGVARIRLLEGGNGELRLQLNGTDLALAANSTVEKDGVVVASRGDTLVIRADEAPALIESVIGAWTLELPLKSGATIDASLSAKTFRLVSPRQNDAKLLLMLPDQGRAELLPAGTVELDIFPENSYSLRGRTNVVATTADGQKLNLSDLQPPMLGGELKQITDSRGTSRFQRATPAVLLELNGSLNGSIQVKGPAMEATLATGQERYFEFANGSSLMLRQDAARQVLEWKVVKGLFQFKVVNFNCWKAIATSGQAGSLQWNPVRKIIDLANRSAVPAFVELSARMHASIGPKATLQYAQFEDCGSFTTSALGGEVSLVNRDTGEVTPVLDGVSFNEGEQIGRAQPEAEGASHEVKFAWQSDSRIELRDSTRLIGISSGQEEAITAGKDKLRAAYAQDGDVTLRAEAGTFSILPGFVPELKLEIPEGGALVLRLDRRRSLFAAEAAKDSAAAIRVVAAGKTYMFLTGSAKLNVVVGESTFLPESAAAWIFFEGAGGESTFSSGPQPSPLIRPDRFDASRIFQQPVSVLE